MIFGLFVALVLLFARLIDVSFAAAPIEAQLDKPITDSIFTFYGAAGRGACGLDVQPCSAAASGDLFDPAGKWVPSDLPDKRSILDDPICKGICIKVEYKGKSAIFPVDNKCPECKPNHVDLSTTAFLVLEPQDVSFAAAPIEAQLDKPIKDSIFTFYGASGRGACGIDVQPCSAAASGDLFDPSAKFVESDMADKRYISNDPICKGICIKVEYQGKSAIFPVDNKCPECKPNHVDLSEKAFLVLEPQGGTVGIAKDATLTYLKCAGQTISKC
ncbi:papain inhibitor [Ditylenchus destructor]|nr:papain inhibitor [Ditylenchus destructor]